ncbi:MAG: NAD-dependent epimerase/dehydratase family protein [Chitinophagales bacterium]
MILVTGGTGLVGSHLLQHLVKQKQKIRAIKRQTSDLTAVKNIADKIEWLDVDLLDVYGLHQAFAGVEKVYHCAAFISFSPADALKMKEINIKGTANIVNMALEHHIKKMIYVSSIAALGRNKRNFHLDENVKWEEHELNSDYALSKHLAEREVWRGAAEGLNMAMVNPSVILGTNNFHRGSGKLIRRVYEGLKFYPAGGTAFVDVEDVVHIMMQLMESDISNQRFIVNAENLSYEDFFSVTAKYLKVKAPTVKIGRFLTELAWRFEAIKCAFLRRKPLITKSSVRIARQRYYYDNAKIKNALQYEFKPFETTMQTVCSSFLEEYK